MKEFMGKGRKNYFYLEAIHGIIILFAFFIIVIIVFKDIEIFSLTQKLLCTVFLQTDWEM